MKFVWDVRKNVANIKKHGIPFEAAIHVFNDEKRIERFDRIHSSVFEERWNVIGMMERIMTLDEIRNSKLTEEQKEMIRNAECNPDDESPAMTAEQLKEFKSGRIYHPQWYKPKKAKINIRIDEDVLAAYKALGKGYQTRMNDALRKAILNN